MWIEFNNNPTGRRVGDCAIRAVSLALDVDWETAYAKIAGKGFLMGDIPSSNSVWGAVLRENGFKRRAVPDTCPDCYTAEDFCEDNPNGLYVLVFGDHVATIKNGDIYDSWDSSMEIPMFYWFKNEQEE